MSDLKIFTEKIEQEALNQIYTLTPLYKFFHKKISYRAF